MPDLLKGMPAQFTIAACINDPSVAVIQYYDQKQLKGLGGGEFILVYSSEG